MFYLIYLLFSMTTYFARLIIVRVRISYVQSPSENYIRKVWNATIKNSQKYAYDKSQ